MVTSEADLVLMCRGIGRNVELTQAGGANASVKNKELMWIKASGFTLEDVNESNGYVIVNHQKIASSYEDDLAENEDQARKIVSDSLIDSIGGLRPSIETGFHSYLGRCVLHTHPIFLNALSSIEKPNLISELKIDDLAIIEYARPGFNLAKNVYSSFLRMKGERAKHPSFILRNHGLLVSGRTPQECLEKTLVISEGAKSLVLRRTGLPMQDYSPTSACNHEGIDGFLGSEIGESLSGTYMFPDAVVFLEDLRKGRGKMKIVDGRVFYELSEKSARNIDEVLFAHNQVLKLAKALGNPKPLAQKDIDELINMEEEKYRRRSVSS